MIENPVTEDERLLRLSEVENMTGFKKSFIYEQGEKGNFPKRIRIGQSARWARSEIVKWMKTQKETQPI